MNTSHHSDAHADQSHVSPHFGEPQQPSRSSWVLPTILAATIVVLVAALLVIVSRDATDAEPPPPGSSVVEERDESADSGSGSENGDNDQTAEDAELVNVEVSPPPTVVNDPSATNPAPVECPTYVTNDDLPLRRCDQGDFVRLAQEGLNVWGAPIEVDGRFGAATAGAVLDFQAAFGLETDATIGPATWAQLCPFSAALCEPDGGEESMVVSSGITVDGAAQNVLYECLHYPFQNVDGVADAHVSVEQYLVQDPSTGARLAIGVWIEDGTRSLVISDLAQASVGEEAIAFASIPAAAVQLPDRSVSVSVDVQGPQNQCDTMFLQGADGAFVAHGVIDVCQTAGDTVVTLSTDRNQNGRHAYSEFLYRADDGLASAQLRINSEYEQLVGGTRGTSARTEDVTGGFVRNGVEWSYSLSISQYPEGGHECVHGQITD